MNENLLKKYANKKESDILKVTYKDFTVSEIKEIIQETPLSGIDIQIAYKKYVELESIDGIAESVGITQETCKSRLKTISPRLKQTFLKMVKFYK